MKKIGKIIVSLMLVVVLLAGCALKEEVGFKIASDKNVALKLVVAYDKEMIDEIISNQEEIDKSEITDDMRWEAIEKDQDLDGFTKTKYNENGWYGYIYSNDLGNIDSLSTTNKNAKKTNISDLDDKEDLKNIFIKDGDKYKSNFTLDMGDTKSIEEYKNYGATFNIMFVVELPTRAISNNASEVSADGKTLKWDLLKSNNVEFVFSFTSNEPTTTVPTTTNSVEPTTTTSSIEPTTQNNESTNTTGETKSINIVLLIIVAIVVFVLFIIIIVIILIIVIVSSKKKPVEVNQPTTVETPQETTTTENNK